MILSQNGLFWPFLRVPDVLKSLKNNVENHGGPQYPGIIAELGLFKPHYTICKDHQEVFKLFLFPDLNTLIGNLD